MKFSFKKGLDVPMTGTIPEPRVHEKTATTVALLGTDFIGMKPSMLVKEGDRVDAGQPLFQCKKNPSARFTSKFSADVVAINRGDKRAFLSMVLNVHDNQKHVAFKSFQRKPAGSWSRNEVIDLLIESGEWVSLRQRPFDKTADAAVTPKALFVTAIDTDPLAPDPQLAMDRWKQEFEAGLELLGHLTEGRVYLCLAEGHSFTHGSATSAHFKGPHPAGLVGTHMHMIYPAGRGREVWHIGYQNVIAIGHLALTGEVFGKKLIGLTGPHARQPKYIETLRGACLDDLVKDELLEQTRLISGSVLNGHTSTEALKYLGHFHNQVSAIKEDPARELLGWHSPGLDRFSNKRIYLSRLIPGKKFALGSNTNGSKRAMVPVGLFESVMPLDILPTQLLRALVSKDIEQAEELGCLELGEEDLALCTFVSPGKVDFGPILRNNLDMIEAEG